MLLKVGGMVSVRLLMERYIACRLESESMFRGIEPTSMLEEWSSAMSLEQFSSATIASSMFPCHKLSYR